jgi:heptosyltransferase-2
MQFVVFGGEEDKAIGSVLEKNKGAINMCGELSLLETAYFISKGKVLVTNDTGLMHMGTAVRTPVLAIFGSTVRELGFFPYRSVSSIIENTNLTCRPCSHIGRNKCPKGHFKCMEDISSEQVYIELKKFIEVNRIR